MIINKKVTGERLKQLRIQKGETQTEIAKLLGSSRQIVSYYETGERMPHVEDLITLAEHFETSVDYLLGLSDVQSLDTQINEVCEYTRLSQKAVELLHNDYFLNLGLTKIVDVLITDCCRISDEEFTGTNSADVLGIVRDYLLLSLDNNEEYQITAEGGLLPAKEYEKIWGELPIRSINKSDLIENVLLSDIQDSLKKLKRILKEGAANGNDN